MIISSRVSGGFGADILSLEVRMGVVNVALGRSKAVEVYNFSRFQPDDHLRQQVVEQMII
jgi:hypothetical protein